MDRSPVSPPLRVSLTEPSFPCSLLSVRPSQWGSHHNAVVNIPTRLLEQVPLLPSPAPASIPVSDMSPAGRYVMRPITQSYLNGTAPSTQSTHIMLMHGMRLSDSIKIENDDRIAEASPNHGLCPIGKGPTSHGSLKLPTYLSWVWRA